MTKAKRDMEQKLDFDESVDISLRMLTSLGFNLAERAKILGYNEPVGDNPAYLESELKNLGKGDRVAERCDMVIDIQARLDGLTKEKDVQARWLNATQKELDGLSPRAAIATGDFTYLTRVASLLEKVTG